MNGIGKRLEEVMNDLRLTYKQIATDVGSPYNNVVRYIKGTRIPDTSFVYQFAIKYGIDVEWLLFGKEKKDTLHQKKVSFMEIEGFVYFVEVNKDVILPYLKNETNYKEPSIIKSYRHKLGLSNKVMKEQMLQVLKQIRKQEDKK